jgi:hypothetical protein
MARRTRTFAWVGAALTCAAALGLSAAGCSSSGSGISDSKIVAALSLKQTSRGYEMGGDPFCTVTQLLNDGDEVAAADDQAGKAGFVIASPDGQVGVLAQRPFAPDCSRRAEDQLKRLERSSE